jgi:hypothetical protein
MHITSSLLLSLPGSNLAVLLAESVGEFNIFLENILLRVCIYSHPEIQAPNLWPYIILGSLNISRAFSKTFIFMPGISQTFICGY